MAHVLKRLDYTLYNLLNHFKLNNEHSWRGMYDHLIKKKMLQVDSKLGRECTIIYLFKKRLKQSIKIFPNNWKT